MTDTGAIVGRTAQTTPVAGTYTVCFQGLSPSADAAARSMLRLLLPMLGNRWQIAQSGNSDVVILEPEALVALSGSGSARPQSLYIVFADDGSPPAGAFATLQRPLSSVRLVEVLHMAQDELEKRLNGPATAAGPADDGHEFRDERRIRTTMRVALSWVLQAKSRAVTVRDLERVAIVSVLPPTGFTTRLRSNQLADLIRTNAPVDLVDLNEHETALLRKKCPLFPLVKLEWIYWLAGSNGKIRPGLSVSHPYQLRKYPDFAVLPHYGGDVRMASLLMAEPMTVGDLAQRAGVRLETACNFVNACWALGCLGDPAARNTSTRAAAVSIAPRPRSEGTVAA